MVTGSAWADRANVSRSPARQRSEPTHTSHPMMCGRPPIHRVAGGLRDTRGVYPADGTSPTDSRRRVAAPERVASGWMSRDPRIVYSTTDGDLRRARDPGVTVRRADEGRVKVRREVAGRRGKAVTTISGVPVDDAGLKALAGRLKKRCGVGGSVKEGVIEIQGDHRATVMEMLTAEGFTPVLSGG